MNRYQEALDNVKADRRDVIGSAEDDYIPYTTLDEIKLLQELVDRATPIDPIYKMNSYNYNQPYCGRCHSMVESNSYKYCPYCGQAIDWK